MAKEMRGSTNEHPVDGTFFAVGEVLLSEHELLSVQAGSETKRQVSLVSSSDLPFSL